MYNLSPNQFITYFIFSLLFIPVGHILYTYLILTINHLKPSKKQIFLFYFTSTLVACSVHALSINFGQYQAFIKLFSAVFIIIPLIKIFFSISIYRSLISFLVYSILTFIANIFSIIALMFAGYPKENITNDINLFVPSQIIYITILTIFIIFIKTFNIISASPTLIKPKAIKTYIYFILVILLLFVTNYFMVTNVNINKNILLLINFLITIFICISSLITINTFINFDYQAHNLKMQIQYNEALENINEQLIRFKHNYANTLSVIKGYMFLNKIKELEEYLDKLIVLNQNFSSVQSTLINKTSIPGLAGLLICKTDYAMKLDVKFNINFELEIKGINMDTYEFMELLGILFDNAIEAASISSKKEVDITILSDSEFKITISNSTDKEVNIQKIFEKGISSKSGENRGYGLYIVKNIVDKYDNITLNTHQKNGYFTQEVIIK